MMSIQKEAVIKLILGAEKMSEKCCEGDTKESYEMAMAYEIRRSIHEGQLHILTRLDEIEEAVNKGGIS